MEHKEIKAKKKKTRPTECNMNAQLHLNNNFKNSCFKITLYTVNTHVCVCYICNNVI